MMRRSPSPGRGPRRGSPVYTASKRFRADDGGYDRLCAPGSSLLRAACCVPPACAAPLDGCSGSQTPASWQGGRAGSAQPLCPPASLPRTHAEQPCAAAAGSRTPTTAGDPLCTTAEALPTMSCPCEAATASRTTDTIGWDPRPAWPRAPCDLQLQQPSCGWCAWPAWVEIPTAAQATCGRTLCTSARGQLCMCSAAASALAQRYQPGPGCLILHCCSG